MGGILSESVAEQHYISYGSQSWSWSWTVKTNLFSLLNFIMQNRCLNFIK